MGIRVNNIYKNLVAVVFAQLVQIFLAFIIRKEFINSLGVEYLGYNSVFKNILQMLSFAEMGIGIAITSFLYKPLAANDTKAIYALMMLYKKLYRVIGIVVFVIGILITPFLGYLIPDASLDAEKLHIFYYINLASIVSTYFLAYKRTLIIADQKAYVTNTFDIVISIIGTIVQIICLNVFSDYTLFLVIGVVQNIITNVIISIKVNHIYGDFRNADTDVMKEYIPQIRRYVKDLFISRIGATVFYGTDNVIISVLKGSILTGYLSNYTMITGYLSSFTGQMLSSLQATFGNFINSSIDSDEQMKMTDNYFCANFLIGNFCMVCYVFLVQPFIEQYLGSALLLPFSTAVWLGVNLMLSLMIQIPSQLFIIYNLFRYDRPIIILSATLNIVISVIMVELFGIDGALIGTFVTSIVYLFSRFFIIAIKVYKTSFFHYIKKILLYFFISLITMVAAYLAANCIYVDNWLFFSLRGIIVAVISVLIPSTMLLNTKEFKFLMNNFLPKQLRRLCSHSILLGITAVIIIVYFLGIIMLNNHTQ